MLSTATSAGWPLACQGTAATQNATAARPARQSRRPAWLLEWRITRITRAIGGESAGETRTCRRFPLASAVAPATRHEPEGFPADRRSDRGGRAWPPPAQCRRPWQCLYFLPDPQGQGALRPTLPQLSGRPAPGPAAAAAASVGRGGGAGRGGIAGRAPSVPVAASCSVSAPSAAT